MDNLKDPNKRSPRISASSNDPSKPTLQEILRKKREEREKRIAKKGLLEPVSQINTSNNKNGFLNLRRKISDQPIESKQSSSPSIKNRRSTSTITPILQPKILPSNDSYLELPEDNSGGTNLQGRNSTINFSSLLEDSFLQKSGESAKDEMDDYLKVEEDILDQEELFLGKDIQDDYFDQEQSITSESDDSISDETLHIVEKKIKDSSKFRRLSSLVTTTEKEENKPKALLRKKSKVDFPETIIKVNIYYLLYRKEDLFLNYGLLLVNIKQKKIILLILLKLEIN